MFSNKLSVSYRIVIGFLALLVYGNAVASTGKQTIVQDDHDYVVVEPINISDIKTKDGYGLFPYKERRQGSGSNVTVGVNQFFPTDFESNFSAEEVSDVYSDSNKLIFFIVIFFMVN